jgi:hypothetical protein
MGKDSGNNAPPDTAMTRMAGPWMPLQKPAQGAISDLSQWYNQGHPYSPGPRVTQPFEEAQKQGMTGMLNLVRGGGGQQAFGDAFNNLSNYAGATPGSMPGQDFYSSLAGGTSPYGNAFQDIYNQAAGGGSNQAFDTMNNFARGDYVGKNPYLDAMYGQGAQALTDQFQQTVNPTIEGLFSKTGGGSGSSQEALLKGQAQRELGTSLGSLATNMYGGAYNTGMSQMLGAAQSIPGMENTRTNTMLGAAGANLGAAQQGVTGLQQNQANAFTQALQGTGALGQAYANQFQPYNIMQGVGNQQQQQATQSAQENQQRFQFSQNAPYQQIMNYLQGLQGVSALAPNAGAVGAQYAQGVMNQPSSGQMAIGNITGLLGAAAPIAGGYYANQAIRSMYPQQQANSYSGPFSMMG